MKSALITLLILTPILAYAVPAPQVRMHVEASQPILVGQQVRVDVTVLVPNFFLSPPQFPSLELPGATATLLDGAQNSSEKIDGEDYAGIQRSYLVTPQQAGELTLPPANITFQYAAEPGKPGVAGVVTLPATTITVQRPTGVAASGSVVPVARVALTQTLDRDLKGLKVGDTLTRTVEAFAPNTQAMMIPPPTFDAPAGVRVYRHDPVLTEVTDGRANFTGGRRVDRVTYTFEQPGDYILAPIAIGWVDAATGERESSRTPELKISVASNPSLKPDIAPEAPPRVDALIAAVRARLDCRRLALVGCMFAVLLAGVWLLRRYGPRYRAWSTARRLARAESEAALFERVERACVNNDPNAAYAALTAWSRAAGADSLTSLAASRAELRPEVAALERCLYGTQSATTGAWSGRALGVAAASARETLRAMPGTHGPSVLPALNP